MFTEKTQIKNKQLNLKENTNNDHQFSDNDIIISGKKNTHGSIFDEKAINSLFIPEDPIKNIQSMIDEYAKNGVATKYIFFII